MTSWIPHLTFMVNHFHKAIQLKHWIILISWSLYKHVHIHIPHTKVSYKYYEETCRKFIMHWHRLKHCTTNGTSQYLEISIRQYCQMVHGSLSQYLYLLLSILAIIYISLYAIILFQDIDTQQYKAHVGEAKQFTQIFPVRISNVHSDSPFTLRKVFGSRLLTLTCWTSVCM